MARGFVTADVNAFLDSNYDDLFAKLHIGDPGAAGTANAAAGDTTRKQAVTGAAAAGVKSMTGTAGPWTHGSAAGTGTETISDITLWTLVTAGTFKLSMPLNVNQAWSGTNTFTLLTMSITVTPLAA